MGALCTELEVESPATREAFAIQRGFELTAGRSSKDIPELVAEDLEFADFGEVGGVASDDAHIVDDCGCGDPDIVGSANGFLATESVDELSVFCGDKFVGW